MAVSIIFFPPLGALAANQSSIRLCPFVVLFVLEPKATLFLMIRNRSLSDSDYNFNFKSHLYLIKAQFMPEKSTINE